MCNLNIEYLNWCQSNVRLLLETKYRRLPVVDADGKLVRWNFIYLFFLVPSPQFLFGIFESIVVFHLTNLVSL